MYFLTRPGRSSGTIEILLHISNYYDLAKRRLHLRKKYKPLASLWHEEPEANISGELELWGKSLTGNSVLIFIKHAFLCFG
jgi:hypothetical protein